MVNLAKFDIADLKFEISADIYLDQIEIRLVLKTQDYRLKTFITNQTNYSHPHTSQQQILLHILHLSDGHNQLHVI
jgi:hypothetical protein